MKNTRFIIVMAMSFCFARLAMAAPLDLSNVPLFAATNAPPANILFVFDDSGSMDWGTVTDQESGTFHFSCVNGSNDGRNYVYPHDSGGNNYSETSVNGGRIPTDEVVNAVSSGNNDGVQPNQGFWRAWNTDYNRLYYDPEVQYLPWRGEDDDGQAYTNATASAARVNPYDHDGSTYNLTTNQSHDSYIPCTYDDEVTVTFFPARYYTWTDSDNDGEVDPDDSHQLIEIRSSGCSSGASCPASFTRGENREDCAAIEDGTGDQCTVAEELQNFANWFQYYRRREFTAKGAYTFVVDDAGAVNMGLFTINSNADNERLSLMSVDANKTSLLDALSKINATGGTPLRESAYDGYRYLSCQSNNYFSVNSDSDCPQASAAEGGACQQSFLVAMTDGYYYGGFDLPGNATQDNADGNDDSQWDGGPYADQQQDTMADIAMMFYEEDISGPGDYYNHPNILPVILGIDEARHQHVVTYSVAFGVNGTLDAMPGPNVDGNNYWPDPDESTDSAIPEKIDDLRHAAFNGRGLFLNASSPNQLVEALSDAILSIGDRASSAASVALNSSSLNSGSHVFQARFDSGDWSGQLLSFPISDGSGQQAGCSGVSLGELCNLAWDAGEVLKGQNWNNGREIITIDPTTNTTGIPFVWDDLENSQKLDLRKHPDSGNQNNVNNGKRRWRFIRGREYPNRNDFRLRSSPLGDIVNSDPFFVGAPQFPYTFNSYASFRSANANRRRMVYVGANDGMLHAFDENTGEELLAYIPGDRRIYDNLTTLASLTYSTKHSYFVDGSPTVGDVYSGTNGTTWKTVLVSGLRAGGQSIFALDVTNPEPANFNESNADSLVLWEFSDEDDKDLGFTYSQPNIVRMANGKWAAVIGNGYNNSDGSGNETAATTSTTGKGYLFIIYIDGPGADGVWDLGTDYVKIEVNSGSVGTPNGLATPAAVDKDGDYDIDVIYAGDLNGNMWRFNVSDPTPANWVVAYSGQPLFVARDASNNRQPITVRPEVSPHPYGTASGYMVLFGTGRYIDAGDNATTGTQTQTFYGIWDQNLVNNTNTIPTRASGLVQQQIKKEVDLGGGSCGDGEDCFRIVTDNAVDLTDGNDRGWYLDLYNTENNNTTNFGEKAVSNPIIRAGRIVFTTLIPSGEVCEFGGDGWLMELNFSTGGPPLEASIDVDGDGDVDEHDVITVNIDGTDVTVPPGGQLSDVGIIPRPTILVVPGLGQEKKYTSGSTGDIGIITERGFDEGRLNWREIR